MTRNLLVHHEGREYVLPETPVPSEARLHDAFESYPQLIPTEELHLGQLMVVGREVGFESGCADLICVDEDGEVVIVELKRGTENPDSRRVVAQLLDYGSRLWGFTYDKFEAEIALPYFKGHFGNAAPSTLRQAAATQFGFEDADQQADAFALALTRALETGTFHYIVIARNLPPNLTTVLRYIGHVSQVETAAIEVDFYQDGDRHILAPHVAYSSASAKVNAPTPQPTIKTTSEQFLQEVGEEAYPFWSGLIDFLETLPGRFYWGTRGFSYRILMDGKQYSVLRGYPRTAWWLVGKGKGDELSIVTAPSAKAPEKLRSMIERATAGLAQVDGAEPYSGPDEKTLMFNTGKGISETTNAEIRKALGRLFQVTAEQ